MSAPKPTPQQMTQYAHAIRAAATVICGSCEIAALALVQAQAGQEAHVLSTHLEDADREAFAADVGRLKATAARALEKASASAEFRANAAGGSC